MSEEKKYEYTLSKGTILKSSEGEYTIKRVLGQGGFGITYEARGRRHGDNVPHKYALKEFFVKGQCWRDGVNPSMKYSPAARSEVNECLRDFKDEAVRLNKICLGNRNIVNVNEVFEANGTAYYVMEYLEGGSLRDKVRNTGGALSEGVALSYIRPIAEAVEYIHSKYALLHCDIKPDNVMFRLDEDGQPTEPVLIDFGISVHFNNKGEVTTTHNSLGVSPGYSPQEQYQGLDMLLDSRKKRMADGFTTNLIPFELDVYSLGATLYYMLVGENPYDAFSINGNTLSKKLPSSLSEKTRNVVLSAMRSSASERTQTARAFLQGFEDRYYLPAGFVLKSPNAAYSIVSGVQHETDYYIKYSAVLYTGQQGESGRGNTTLSRRYAVYELFEKGCSQRKKDESVAQIDSDAVKSNGYTSFLSLCRERTGLSEMGNSDFENGVISRELFFGNGTIYAVAKQGWKPQSHIVQIINEIAEKFRKKKKLLIKIAASVAGILFLVNGCSALITYFEEVDAQIEQEINANLSQAKTLIDTDTVKARKCAEQVLSLDSGNKEAWAILEKIAEMNKPASSSAEQEKLQTTPEPKQPSTDVNANANDELAKKKEEERKRQDAEKKKQEELKKKQEQNMSSCEDALNNNDWKSLEKYANQGNTKAADALATHYAHGIDNNQNNKLAEKWANKASPQIRKEVRHILYLRGYLIEDN